jgi:hypothetical protein
MEIHSHPKQGTGKKKWTEYLWEFFMLFLAVTLGFFVENKREQVAEKHRGIQYIRSFVEDLEQDTVIFSYLVDAYTKKAIVLDGIYTCYDSVNGKLHSTDCLINITGNATGFPDFIYTERTLQQLKNAGGLRLLNNTDADSITAFDNAVRVLERSETTELQETQNVLRSIIYELINFGMLREGARNDNPENMRMNGVPALFGNNPVLLNKYFNILFQYDVLIHDQVTDIEKLKVKASSLISYFKREHRLS